MKKKKSDSILSKSRQSNALSPDIYSKKREYKRKRHFKAYLIVILSVLTLTVAAFLIVSFMKIGVIDNITLEAGEEPVKAIDYFENKNVNAEFIGKSEIDTTVPGMYKLTVRNGILFYNVTLTVQDTVAPTAKTKNVKIRQGEKTVSADSFVKSIKDKTDVTATFKEPIDYSVPGDKAVTVVLTDLGGNQTEYTSKLTIYPDEVLASHTVEAGDGAVDISDFFKEGTSLSEDDKIITDIEKIDFHTVETHEIEIDYNSNVYTVILKVDDTIPPAGYIINRSTYKGVPIEASSFIRTFYDETNVTVRYGEEPDFKTVGAKVITIILTDEGSNTKSYNVTLTVMEDITGPYINAVNRTVYIGDNVRFSEGVTAIDDNDGEVEFEIDSSSFDGEQVGSYPIIFTAKDKAGNESKKTVYFAVRQKRSWRMGQYTIDTAFNNLYNEIVSGNMTQNQILRAIYDYIRENIAYNGTSDKSDYEQEAYRGITNKVGDSFTYYSVARKLLTMAGIENKGAQRINSDSNHYWNLVKKDGKWYHFDTCPHYKDFPLDSFMLTDEEAEVYSQKTNGYYEYEAFE